MSRRRGKQWRELLGDLGRPPEAAPEAPTPEARPRLRIGDFIPEADRPDACPTCGCVCRGIPPLWNLQTAAELIPMTSVQSLHTFLTTHKAIFVPRRYMKVGHTEVRMLTEEEILRIRSMTMDSARGAKRADLLLKRAAKLREKHPRGLAKLWPPAPPPTRNLRPLTEVWPGAIDAPINLYSPTTDPLLDGLEAPAPKIIVGEIPLPEKPPKGPRLGKKLKRPLKMPPGDAPQPTEVNDETKPPATEG
jgi:hypothetical protein